MSISISGATPVNANHPSTVPAASSPAPAASAAATTAKAQSGANDTVQISSAAQAALKESLETPVDTAREASRGDNQAKRLLAKEAADKAV